MDFLGTVIYSGDSHFSGHQNPPDASRVNEQTLDVSGDLSYVGWSRLALTEGDKGRLGCSPQGRVRLPGGSGRVNWSP